MSEDTDKVTIYGWMGERLNLTGSDLIVYAAFYEAGTRGISVSGETNSASSLVGMNVSTFTRTRARLVIAGLVKPVETPGRGEGLRRHLLSRAGASGPRPETETRSNLGRRPENRAPHREGGGSPHPCL